ncbi:MAG TPA: hypothetical protein VFN11_07165 [Ktedonobacterales bacterium]|nr:hypothetical protein [Ktedonobacterales bacterium]
MTMKSHLGMKPSALRWLPQTNVVGTPYLERMPDGIRALESIETHSADDWLRVSVSFHDRLPSWQDMCKVKVTCCGQRREAYIVLPPTDRYVNDHPHVLHTRCMVDGPVLPDFHGIGPFGRMTL